MSPAAIFSIANTLALVTWLLLVLFQRRSWARNLVVPTVAATLAACYAAIIGSTWVGSTGGFGSLEDVAQLFSQQWLLLAGWLHYLAFDLLAGRWEAEDAARAGISPWLVAPCLGLTFLFGPAGWLAYLLVRRTARGAGNREQGTGIRD